MTFIGLFIPPSASALSNLCLSTTSRKSWGGSFYHVGFWVKEPRLRELVACLKGERSGAGKQPISGLRLPCVLQPCVTPARFQELASLGNTPSGS